MWNLKSGQCVRTLNTGYGLCGIFVPGNQHVIIGTKSGTLDLYELATGDLVESIQAHSGAVWSIALSPSRGSMMGGSADKTVKLWDFVLKETAQDESKSKR